MNHSIATADRNTHLKIVVLALLGAIAVVCVGITARLAGTGEGVATAGAERAVKVGVVKPTKPVAFSTREASAVR